MKPAELKKGKVYLVGAGPGDAGLLTVKGAALLAEADVVVYDWLVAPEILDWARRAEKIYVGKNVKSPVTSHQSPVKNRKSKEYVEQEQTNQLLVKLAKQGKKVVRLKGGDPFVFGRGGEEASYLKEHGIPFEVVPGVSAGYAVPAYAGIPVTDRRFASSVTFVTAHENPKKKKSTLTLPSPCQGEGKGEGAAVPWDKLAKINGTLVIFMGVGTLPKVIQDLRKGGKSPKTPVSVIEWGTLPRQRVAEGTLKTIVNEVRRQKIESPAVTVIGEVNRLRKKLDWFKKGALSGKTVLVTRARAQASELRRSLEQQGARVLEFPAIEILPPEDFKPLDEAFEKIRQFDWVIFTSANGVESVFNRLEKLGCDVRIFAGVKIAAIGDATARLLQRYGVKADLVPQKFTSAALVEELKKQGEISGKSFLLARTDIAPQDLKKELEALGGRVTEATVYRTVPAPRPEEKKKLREWILKNEIDYVTFTSSSTVENFFKAVPEGERRRLRSRFVSIGPVTSKTLKSYGFKPYCEAKEHTIPGLIKTLVNGGRSPHPSLSPTGRGVG